MKIADIKYKMMEYRDFYGGDLYSYDEISKAKSKKELLNLLNRHESHMESMLSDAMSHMSKFKKEVGLIYL